MSATGRRGGGRRRSLAPPHEGRSGHREREVVRVERRAGRGGDLEVDGGLRLVGDVVAQAEQRRHGVEQTPHARGRDAGDVTFELPSRRFRSTSSSAATGARSSSQPTPADRRCASATRHGLRMAASPPGSGTYAGVPPARIRRRRRSSPRHPRSSRRRRTRCRRTRTPITGSWGRDRARPSPQRHGRDGAGPPHRRHARSCAPTSTTGSPDGRRRRRVRAGRRTSSRRFDRRLERVQRLEVLHVADVLAHPRMTTDATQNVFFNSPPTASTDRRAPGIATGIGA
jgi:hypothetical protein